MLYCKDCNCIAWEDTRYLHEKHNMQHLGYAHTCSELGEYSDGDTIFLKNKTAEELIRINQLLKEALKWEE